MPARIPLRGLREEKNLYSDAEQGKMSSSVIELKIKIGEYLKTESEH